MSIASVWYYLPVTSISARMPSDELLVPENSFFIHFMSFTVAKTPTLCLQGVVEALLTALGRVT